MREAFARTQSPEPDAPTPPTPKKRQRRQPVPVSLITPEETARWGKMVVDFWNQLADFRGYTPMGKDSIERLGEPAALTAKKYGVDRVQETRPWIALLIVATPNLGEAAKIEYARIARWWGARQVQRGISRPTARVGASRHLGHDRLGEDGPEQDFATRPNPGSSR